MWWCCDVVFDLLVVGVLVYIENLVGGFDV